MQPSDTEVFHFWMKGESIGQIAKRYDLNKGQVRRIVNRVIAERNSNTEDMLELQDEETSSGRQV